MGILTPTSLHSTSFPVYILPFSCCFLFFYSFHFRLICMKFSLLRLLNFCHKFWSDYFLLPNLPIEICKLQIFLKIFSWNIYSIGMILWAIVFVFGLFECYLESIICWSVSFEFYILQFIKKKLFRVPKNKRHAQISQ